jgi:hypothetical protein
LQAKAGDHHTLLGLDLLVAPANFHRDTSSGDEVLQFKLEAATLLRAIAKLVLPWRPNRCEPRAVKRRPKPHRLLTKPRHVERERLEQRQRKILAAFA